MLKCKYNEDCSRYPMCGKTCGLTLEELVWRKNAQIRELKHEMQNAKFILKCIEGDLRKAENILQELPYEPTCPCGHTDCVSDPAYIRWSNPKWWEELDMPTTCADMSYGKERYEVLEDGVMYCPCYDDEDK